MITLRDFAVKGGKIVNPEHSGMIREKIVSPLFGANTTGLEAEKQG